MEKYSYLSEVYLLIMRILKIQVKHYGTILLPQRSLLINYENIKNSIKTLWNNIITSAKFTY